MIDRWCLPIKNNCCKRCVTRNNITNWIIRRYFCDCKVCITNIYNISISCIISIPNSYLGCGTRGVWNLPLVNTHTRIIINRIVQNNWTPSRTIIHCIFNIKSIRGSYNIPFNFTGVCTNTCYISQKSFIAATWSWHCNTPISSSRCKNLIKKILTTNIGIIPTTTFNVKCYSISTTSI